MNGNEGKRYFGIGLDTSELEKSKGVAISMFSEISKQAEESGKAFDSSFTEAIEKVKADFESLDPNFADNIQAEIDKNVNSLEELRERIQAVGQESIELESGGFLEQAKEIYAEVDGINQKMDELETAIESSTSTEQTEKLWNQYALLNQELEKKNGILDTLEAQYESSNEASILAENEKLYAQLNEQAQQLEGTIDGLKNVQAEYNQKVNESTQDQDQLGDAFKSTIDQMNPMGALLGSLPAPIRSVVIALQGMTGAMRTFVAIPLIAVISAIALGLMTLHKWFTSSAEGQMKFAKITGYLSGILDQLGEIVLSVGEAIYNAFTNPQEAVKKLWEVIKENIVNRIKGLGKIFESIGTIITSGFTKGYKELGDAVIQTTTGVEGLIDKGKAYLNHLDDMGKKTADLSVRTEKLSRDRSNWLIKEEELNSKIAEARNKMYSAQNDAQKKEAGLALEAFVNQKYEQKIKFAKEELAIKKEMNALTTNAQADYDAENDLQAELLRLQTARTNELSRSARMLGAMERKAGKGPSQMQAEAEQVAQYRAELEALQVQVAKEEYELDTSQMTSRLDVLEAQFNYELALIQKNKSAFEQMYADVENLDTSSFDTLMAMLVEKRAIHEKEYLDGLIEQYQTAEQKRNAIVERYAKERIDLEKTGAEDAILENLNKKEREELAKFDTLVQDKGAIISTMFADMGNKSIEELQKIYLEAKKLFDFLTAGEWDTELGASLGITKEQFDEIISDPQKLAQFKEGLKDIENAILDISSPLAKISAGFKDLFNQDNMNPDKIKKALAIIKEGFDDYAGAVNTVSGALHGLADLTGSGLLSSVAEGLDDVVSVAGDAMAGAQTGAMFGPVGAVVGGILGAFKGIAGVFSKNKQHRDELRKQVKENQEKEYFGQLEIEAIWRSKYEWSKRIGETTLTHIKREGEELKKQAKENEKAQADLWSKLRQEQYKSGEHFKRTGLFGWGKGKIVEEWSSLANLSFEQIEKLFFEGKLSDTAEKYYEALKKAREEGEDLEQMQLEYLEKMREIYTGTSYEGLVSGIVDAFKQGKRSAKDFADSFEDLLENAITSSLQLLADDAMREWYEDFAEKGKDGFTQEELDQLKADWIRLNENLAEQATALEEATGVVIGGTEQQQGRGNVGVYEKVTQDQWSETDGLFRGMHMVSLQNSDYLKSIVGWGEHLTDVRTIALDSWSELVGINKNTKLLNETNEILTDLKRNGIKVL